MVDVAEAVAGTPPGMGAGPPTIPEFQIVPVRGLAIVAAVLVALVLLTNVVLLGRIRPFAWRTFFLVGKWSLAAYAVISGMLVYVFARDHTPAGPMTVLAVMLAIFAVTIPMLFALAVARYQQP